jgi:hypothetical protein
MRGPDTGIGGFRGHKSTQSDARPEAGWCSGDGESGARYRREAVIRFEDAIDAGPVPQKERATITYLIGELHRRTGNAEKAKLWFARVPDAVAGAPDRQWLVDLAIQQSTNPKDFVDE